MGNLRNGSCRCLGDTCCCRGDNFCFTAAITSHRPLLSTFGGTHLSMKKTRAVKWERGRAKERYREKDTVNVFLLASGPGGILLQPFRRSSSSGCFDLYSLGLIYSSFSSCFCVSHLRLNFSSSCNTVSEGQLAFDCVFLETIFSW